MVKPDFMVAYTSVVLQDKPKTIAGGGKRFFFSFWNNGVTAYSLSISVWRVSQGIGNGPGTVQLLRTCTCM